MERCFSAVVGIGVFSLLLGGCQPADTPGEGDAAEARQAQVPTDPDHDWRHYSFDFQERPFAHLLVIGDTNVEGFTADTEYWYVDSSGLEYLGEDDLEVSYQDGNGTPPSLSGDQEFTQPVYLTWQSFEEDPVSTGDLYSNGGHHLRIRVQSGEVTRLTWYQTLTHQSPQNAAPNGTFSAVGGEVKVPDGQYGYYIDAAIE